MDTKLNLTNKLAKLQAKLARYAGKVTRFVRSKVAWLLVQIERVSFVIESLSTRKGKKMKLHLSRINPHVFPHLPLSKDAGRCTASSQFVIEIDDKYYTQEGELYLGELVPDFKREGAGSIAFPFDLPESLYHRARQILGKVDLQSLPELQGSEKQVNWANDLRLSLIDKIEEYQELHPKKTDQINAFLAKFITIIKASKIIEIYKSHSQAAQIVKFFDDEDED